MSIMAFELPIMEMAFAPSEFEFSVFNLAIDCQFKIVTLEIDSQFEFEIPLLKATLGHRI